MSADKALMDRERGLRDAFVSVVRAVVVRAVFMGASS